MQAERLRVWVPRVEMFFSLQGSHLQDKLKDVCVQVASGEEGPELSRRACLVCSRPIVSHSTGERGGVGGGCVLSAGARL